jgi:RES domain-containing protein
MITPRPTKPVLLHKISLELQSAVSLSHERLGEFGVDLNSFEERDYARTQEIGDAINFLQRDALIVPSARFECNNIVLFMGNHDASLEMSVAESTPVDWNSWRAARAELPPT